MKTLIIVIALLVMGTASAQDARSVFGMQLQAPITLHECTLEKIGKSLSYKLVQPRTCYQRSRDIGQPLTTDTVEIKWQPYPPMVSPAGFTFAIVIDGNLEGLSFNTLGVVSQDRDLALLVDKYGQPAKLTRPQLQNGYGAQYVGILASWDLDEVVSFESAAGNVNSGTVIIDTPKGAAARFASRKGAAL